MELVGIMNKIEVLDLGKIKVKKENLKIVLMYLKNNTLEKYEQLMTIIGQDNISYPGWSGSRFEVVYILLSLRKRKRLTIVVELNEEDSLESIVEIYPNGGWYEREVWDLFGIDFINNPDMRRILTDYGYKGHPLRKDYPLSGHYQLKYDHEGKRLISESVELAQELRRFTPHYKVS